MAMYVKPRENLLVPKFFFVGFMQFVSSKTKFIGSKKQLIGSVQCIRFCYVKLIVCWFQKMCFGSLLVLMHYLVV